MIEAWTVILMLALGPVLMMLPVLLLALGTRDRRVRVEA